MLPFEVTSPEDWEYIKINPATGCRFDEVNAGEFELVIERDPGLDLLQGVFVTYPELNEYRTRDIWKKHPTKEHLWLYEGRTDDIIVFNNDEKLNPLTMEQTIENHSSISSALVVGTGHFQPSLLVELREPPTTISKNDQATLVNMIWPSVQAANEITVAYGRIDKDFIIFTTKEKPFLRANKGSVQRKLTQDLYSHKLDAASDHLSLSTLSKLVLNFSSLDDSKRTLRSAITAQLGYKAPPNDNDLFNYRLDSLHITNLSRQLSATHGTSCVSP